MDRSSVPLLTPFNYDEWKMKMMDFLKRKRLFKITMGTETKPLLDDEKTNGLTYMTKPMVFHVSLFLLIFLIRSYLSNHQMKSGLHWKDYLARKMI